MSAWRRFHRWNPIFRWPLKLVGFAALALLILFPRVWLVPTLLERVQDLDKLIEPDLPALAPLEADLRAKLEAEPNSLQPAEMLNQVEAIVYEHVPYSWDWITWGNMEYLPTTAEVLAQGREDCDGRAVVAAALLRRMGHDAWLETDLLHMWVGTPEGETMSPTSNAKTLVGGKADETGARATNWEFTAESGPVLARGFAYGVVVFPLLREVMLLAALALVSMHPWANRWRILSGVLLLWIGLDLARGLPPSVARSMSGAQMAQLAAAIGVVFVGWLLIAIRANKPVAPPA